ncbi:MAG: (2Fe-2S) ferredoxin domain-containing protein [Pseudomonadota bacterium]
MSFDVPQVFKRHVFFCMQQRPEGHPRGSCSGQGAAPLWEYLSAKLEVLRKVEIGRTATGCFGFCQAGPVMVVYPEGVWYTPRSSEDIDEIIETHLVGGALVERLAIVPRP